MLMSPLPPAAEPLCHRLFLALKPPPEVAARIGRLRDELDGTPVSDERLHLTLLALPDSVEFPEALAESVAEAAGDVRAAPVSIILDQLVSGSHSVLLAPREPLESVRLFRERLGFTLLRAGLDLRLARRFSPHVTLLYNNLVTFDREIEPIIWRAEEFVLVHSLVGLTQHVELGRWALAG